MAIPVAIEPKRILVVGAGIAGASAALALAESKHQVDLVELSPDRRANDIGVWLPGPAFRAMAALDLFDECLPAIAVGNNMRVCSETGEVIREISTSASSGGGRPSGGNMVLTDLHDLLHDRVSRAGVGVRFATGIETLHQDADGVDVAFGDGRTQRYDAVIGSDGIRSRVRDLAFPSPSSIEYGGQNFWRLRLPADPRIDCRHVFTGVSIRVGLSPLPRDEMYLFLQQMTPVQPDHAVEDRYLVLRELLAGYEGVLGDVRDRINADSPIRAYPLETLAFDGGWIRQRVALIGDASHPIPPQLPVGICLAIEDGAVLAEELAKAGPVADALSRFAQRRLKRCRRLAENAQEIVRRQNDLMPQPSITAVFDQALGMLAEPF